MTVTNVDATWASRVRGALLLSAWADTVGASDTVRRFICERGQVPDGLRWSWTRARARSMWVLAEHLSRHGGRVDQAELGRALFRDGPQDRPRAEAWLAGSRPRVPHARAWTGAAPTGGRGGRHRSPAVTTVPVGLVPRVGLEVIARRARRAAAVGQAHPQALDVAAVQAVTVAAVVRSAAEPVDAGALVGRASAYVGDSGLRAALRLAPVLAKWEAHAQQVALQLNRYPRPVAAVAVGLAAFLRHQDDPWAAPDTGNRRSRGHWRFRHDWSARRTRSRR